MPQVGFETLIPASELPQTHALRLRNVWDRQSPVFKSLKDKTGVAVIC